MAESVVKDARAKAAGAAIKAGPASKSEPETAPVPAKRGARRLVLFGTLAAVLLAVGGGTAWYLLHGESNDPEAIAAADAERKRKELKARVFLPLEQFTVNLADAGERFAQVAVVLEVVNAQSGEDIKTQMPAVRNRILLLLSSKQSKELLSLAGKEQLAREIADATSRTVGWNPSHRKPISKKAHKPADGASTDEASDDPASDGKEPDDGASRAQGEPVPIPVVNVHFSQFIVQ